MNTFITRVWMDNRNHFIITDCPEKKDQAINGFKSRGGRVLESTVSEHELGEVLVLRKDDPAVEQIDADIDLTSHLVQMGFLSRIESSLIKVAQDLVDDEVVTREDAARELIQIGNLIHKDMNGIYEFYRNKEDIGWLI